MGFFLFPTLLRKRGSPSSSYPPILRLSVHLHTAAGEVTEDGEQVALTVPELLSSSCQDELVVATLRWLKIVTVTVTHRDLYDLEQAPNRDL